MRPKNSNNKRRVKIVNQKVTVQPFWSRRVGLIESVNPAKGGIRYAVWFTPCSNNIQNPRYLNRGELKFGLVVPSF